MMDQIKAIVWSADDIPYRRGLQESEQVLWQLFSRQSLHIGSN